jgi:hypothetical protein
MNWNYPVTSAIVALAWTVVPASSLAQGHVTLPVGTRLPLAFETTVSSNGSHRGDLVVAKTTANVRAARGEIVIPAGSEVRGRVTTAYPGGKIKGRARLVVTFDRVLVRGQEQTMTATPVDVTAPSGAKRDAAVIAGSTIGGAVVGGIIGGRKGSRVGAVAGAGASTGSVLTTRGKQVEFPAGMRRTVKLTRSLRVAREIKVPSLPSER